MRDLPASPRQGSPALAPRRLSEELGDFMFSSDEYDDEEEGDEEDENYDGIETPASSRKSSQSLDGYFDEVDAYKHQQLQDTTSESERTEKKNDSRPSTATYNSRPSTATYSSRPSTAVSMPPFRRSSTCPVLLPDDFISSAADEVVKIMPDQAAFMKRMVEGWREIQRRSSVSTTISPMSPASTTSPGTINLPKRPQTAPSPMYAPQMCFASFPQAVPEQDEDDSPTESVDSFSNVVERLDKVEETLEELRDLAKQQAGAAIASNSASVTEQNAKFAVVNKCIDTIGRVCEREQEVQDDSQLDRRCVDALVQICEMFARESVDQDPHRFGSSFMAEESEDDDVEYEGEDEEEVGESDSDGESHYGSDDDYEAHPIDSDPTEYESGDFLGKSPTIETDKTLPPLLSPRTRSSTPTQVAPVGTRIEAPDTPRRRARLVREAKAELDALFSEWAEPKNSYEERHSRIVYATEAYHLRLVDMKSAHECEFKWKNELMNYEEKMKDRGAFGPNVWPIVDLALPIAQCLLSVTLLVVHFFSLDSWLVGQKAFLAFLAAWLASVAVLARCTEVKARETLYKTMLPPDAREMRRRHERELVLLKAAHDRAVQRVYAPEQQSRAEDRS
ncbi:uncharacterized protein CCOS01_12878 [Colletotrichum costaricense]|uniref:Transmembrane protein n=1 Tax=Colletotrichum costaricense TaxID=1209916 RepID=A0AAI9YM11_9PEZI|nr:uncharacterized protein CCOS01_12878 [Colletotrichum costaricense]KAK1515680.1 hypothetical protein CCOS01_12878 [Colletotrichum costaricense]